MKIETNDELRPDPMCRHCKHWATAGQIPGGARQPLVGHCRRLPPTVISAAPVKPDQLPEERAVDVYFATSWPVTSELSLCGKYSEDPVWADRREYRGRIIIETEDRDRSYAAALRPGFADDQPF